MMTSARTAAVVAARWAACWAACGWAAALGGRDPKASADDDSSIPSGGPSWQGCPTPRACGSSAL